MDNKHEANGISIGVKQVTTLASFVALAIGFYRGGLQEYVL